MYRRDQGLGVVPLVVAGAAAGGAAAMWAWDQVSPWASYWAGVLGQSTGAVADPKMRPAPAPQFQAPPAPQTPGKMTTWNPGDVLEAQAQRAVQFKVDTEYLREVMTDARTSRTSGNPAAAGGAVGWGTWAVIAAAGLGVLILTRR